MGADGKRTDGACNLASASLGREDTVPATPPHAGIV